ncbi:MAG: calcium/sodium antiporter [Planctomycetota bacterium]|nr:calcium/sodium antiporter [Planctomycetota bacterium]
MSLVLPTVMIVSGLVLLIAGAEAMVRGAASLAKKMSISEIAIALTVVAFGTSAPELLISIFAAGGGQHEIVFGDVIGSNMANTLLILGVAGLIYPLTVQKNTVWKEIPFLLLATLVVFMLVNDSWGGAGAANLLSRTDGLVLLGFLAIFLIYTFGISRIESVDQYDVVTYSYRTSGLMIVGGLAALFFGGRFTVNGAIDVATQLGVSKKLIACTIIAGGTSLPELATSAVAAYRKRCDIAVGNIVGSCILNLLMVLGISGVVYPIAYSSLFNVDSLAMIAATIVLFLTMFTGKKRKLDRWEAVLLLMGYVAYVGYLVHRR